MDKATEVGRDEMFHLNKLSNTWSSQICTQLHILLFIGSFSANLEQRIPYGIRMVYHRRQGDSNLKTQEIKWWKFLTARLYGFPCKLEDLFYDLKDGRMVWVKGMIVGEEIRQGE